MATDVAAYVPRITTTVAKRALYIARARISRSRWSIRRELRRHDGEMRRRGEVV
jgi:hypothetical protein